MSTPPDLGAAHGSSMRQRWLPMSGAVFVGALTVIQSRINGQLGHELGSGFLAAWISFLVGLALILVVVFCWRSNREALGRLKLSIRPDGDGEPLFNPWYLLGGLGGATFVAAQSSTVQYLGVAVFTVSVVAAQNASSLFVDRVGLGPHGVQPITGVRVLAAVVATVGVAIAVVGQSSSETNFAISALAFALFAGAVIAIQQAVNGRVARAAGSPWIAGLANFTVGWLGLSVALLVISAFQGWPTGSLPSLVDEPWIYIGGFIGVAFIVVAAAVVHSLGVLLFALLSIAGQMTGALLIDVFLPEAGKAVTWQLFVGVLVTAAAVAFATLTRHR